MSRRQAYLQKLADRDAANANNIATQREDNEQEEEVEHKIVGEMLESDYKIGTGFTKDEFLHLYSVFDNDIARTQSVKELKHKLSGHDKLYLLLTNLKSYSSFTSLALIFKISAPTLQKTINK